MRDSHGALVTQTGKLTSQNIIYHSYKTGRSAILKTSTHKFLICNIQGVKPFLIYKMRRCNTEATFLTPVHLLFNQNNQMIYLHAHSFANYITFNKTRGTRCRSWLRHCVTSPKVTGSIPDGVTCTMALGFTQHLTETSTKNNSLRGGGVKGGWLLGLPILPPSCADCLEIWEPQPPGTLWACPGLWWDCFTCTFTFTFNNTT
jgi:hypothetical protein